MLLVCSQQRSEQIVPKTAESPISEKILVERDFRDGRPRSNSRAPRQTPRQPRFRRQQPRRQHRIGGTRREHRRESALGATAVRAPQPHRRICAAPAGSRRSAAGDIRRGNPSRCARSPAARHGGERAQVVALLAGGADENPLNRTLQVDNDAETRGENSRATKSLGRRKCRSVISSVWMRSSP